MKTTPFLAALLIGVCQAQQPSPFVQKGGPKKEAPEPAGPSYVGILEQIMVPPDLIDDWFARNGIPEDATELRAAVQDWIREGRASCDHTALSMGIVGRTGTNESILEQIYPTEYAPNGAGVWPLPTAFETRNLGYTVEFRSGETGGVRHVSAEAECVEMLGSNTWHPLMEKTRQPGDVFMPEIRSYRLSEGAWTDYGGVQDDPFASNTEPVRKRSVVTPAARPGAVTLVFRMDPLPSERRAGLQTRLVFMRGMVEPEIPEAAALPPRMHVSYRALKVPHTAFSTWLQQQPPLEVPREAWDFVGTLAGDQTPAVLEVGDGIFQSDSKWVLENVREVIYPTEWQPNNVHTMVERWEEPKNRNQEGKNVTGIATMARYEVQAAAGLAGASLPTSFETRNTGVTLEMSVDRSVQDQVVRLSFERVDVVGESIYRRIEDNGNWIPDMKLPLFATNRCNTACRLEHGRWTLVSTGTEFSGPGKADRDHCLLVFVKVQ